MAMPRTLPFDLRSLEIFAAVIETGGMTAAARRLGLTQSAVSQTVAHLEKGLSAELLDRTLRPAAPTPAGQVLYDRAQALLVDALALESSVRQAAESRLPRLIVGMIDSVAATIGPSVVETLRHTAEQWSILSGLSPSHTDGLLGRTLDVIVATEAAEERTDLDRHHILTEPFVLALPRNWTATADDLHALAARLDLVRYSGRSAIGRQVDRQLSRLRLNTPRRIEFDGTEAALAMVGGGAGWAITTPLCALQAAGQARSVQFQPLRPGFTRTIELVARPRELGDVPFRLAEACREICDGPVRRQIGEMSGWMADGMHVGSMPDGAAG